jgi:phage gpG-like protein
MAELRGFEEMLAALKAKGAKVQVGTPQALLKAGHRVEAEVKKLLSLSSHPPGTPTPSAPGSPPSLVTGNLRRSVRVGDLDGGGTRWRVSVSSNTVYSRIQEFGGRANHSSLPPRPYMAPGLALASAAVRDDLRQAWADALRT